MIIQFLCINSIRAADDFTEFNLEPDSPGTVYPMFDDLLKVELNKFDQLHMPLLKEHNYSNQLSWCWDLTTTSSNYRQAITRLTRTMVQYVLAGANPNIASDISQTRILHLLSALISSNSVDYVERLIVHHKANPFLKDADGNNAFSYAQQQLISGNHALYQKIVMALHKYKTEQ